MISLYHFFYLGRYCSKKNKFVGNIRNKERIKETTVEKDEELQDFYNTYDWIKGTKADHKKHKKFIESMNPEDKELYEAGYNYYQIELENLGGLPMPVILEFEFEDGSKELRKLPAEIWKFDDDVINKVFFFKEKLKQLSLDPYLETADIDMDNNYYPRKIELEKFKVNKKTEPKYKNPMQKAKNKD